MLSEEEKARAERFRYELHRKRWVFARAWLRRSLGEILGRQASNFEFRITALGKPYLEGNPVYFNLAHSGDLVILAWSEAEEVGVDIEERQLEFAWEDVAAQAFSTAERKYLERLPEQERRSAFYDVWTLKEAYVKAVGCGIGIATSQFSVRPEASLGADWNLRQIEVQPGYSAALAWKAVEM